MWLNYDRDDFQNYYMMVKIFEYIIGAHNQHPSPPISP